MDARTSNNLCGKNYASYGGQSGINPEHEHFWDWEYIDADSSQEIIKAIRKNVYYRNLSWLKKYEQ